jgi:hypothetical protein
VAGEIVHDDDVAWRERGTQLLLDPSREGRSVDRLIEAKGASIRSQRKAAMKVIVFQ